MEYLIKPWAHQQEAINIAANRSSYALFFEMGCVANDVVIKISRGKAARRHTIEELYRLFNSTELSNRQRGFDKSIKTYVRSLNEEDKTIRLNEIEGVFRSGIKEVFSIQTSCHGNIKLTANHRVFTKRGWVRVDNLICEKDFIAYDFLVRHQSKKVKTKAAKAIYKYVKVGSYHKYNSGHLEKHRAIYEANVNGLSLSAFIAATKVKNNLKFIDPKKFHIHHKDHCHLNNSIDNLECLSITDHAKLHAKGYSNFDHGGVSWRRVKTIYSLGEQVVYDIRCKSPHNNFVANNFVIHNSGKTATAINILRHWMLKEKRVLNTLILCPPAIIGQWGDEFKTYSRLGPHVKLLNQNTGAKKKKALQESIQRGEPAIYITNYETLLNKEFYAVLNSMNIDCLICDESHKLKSLQAKRTKLVIDLAKKTSYRLILTGTPILNSPVDLFSQYLILDKGKSFGANYFVFRARYFYDANSTMPKHIYFPNWKPRPKIEEELNNIIAESSMRVRKSECLDLPPLLKQKIHVPLTKQQEKVYGELKQDFITYLEDKHCVADLALTKLLRMQQVLCGHLPLEDMDGQNKEIKRLDNNRINALRDILLNAVEGSKVIVWTTFRETYKEIGEMLEKQNIGYSKIIGGQTPSQRQEAIDGFKKDEKIRVCIASQKAGGVGLNLTESNIAIYYSRNYSLEDDLQSEARNYRGGSEVHSKVTRIDLVTRGTIDETILDALAKKVNLAENILDYKDQFI